MNPDLDDASSKNLSALVNKAKELIHAEQDRIKSLAKELAKPKADVQPKGSFPEKGILRQIRTKAGA